MDIYKHSAVSLTLSAILLLIFKNIQMAIACFLTGVFVDLDHLFDYIANREIREKLLYLIHPKELAIFLFNGYTDSPKVSRLYKLLHSIELLALVPLIYALGFWNPVATGILLGFLTHLIMDFVPLGHIGSVSIIYKIINGFPKGSAILGNRLSKIGVDVNKCQACGAKGDMILHKDQRYWYIGFTNKGLHKVRVLCETCHDKAHEDNNA